MLDKLEQSFNNPSTSDFTVRCRGNDFQVHCVILSCYRYFETAISERYAEGCSRILVLDEEPPNVIGPMLRYLYTNTISNEVESDLGLLAQLFVVGDKYGLVELKRGMTSKFVSKAASMKLKEGQRRYEYTDYEKKLVLDCLELIMNCVPKHDPEKKEIFDNFFMRHRMLLLTSNEEAKAFLQTFPDLAEELALLAVTGHLPTSHDEHLDCPGCGVSQCLQLSYTHGLRRQKCDSCGIKYRLEDGWDTDLCLTEVHDPPSPPESAWDDVPARGAW